MKFEFEDGVRAAPATGQDGTIYAGASVVFAALSPSGDVVRMYRADQGGFDSSPALGRDGTIYVGGGATLFAFAL